MAEIPEVTTGHARSADGVKIVYATAGSGPLTLVFVHGGLANRRFWREQMTLLAERFRLVGLDLAGHGDSGRNRRTWSMPAFGEDVRAVVDALRVTRAVLIGNSLGGPVALEAAARLPGRIAAVIGVDTFQDLTVVMPSETARARARDFGEHPAEAVRAMTQQLFHAGQHEELRGWAETEMRKTPKEVVVPMLEAFGGYDPGAAARRARVPIRAVNGDLWPTAVDKNRTVAPDFDVVTLPKAGHYPMLESPARFNAALLEVIAAVT